MYTSNMYLLCAYYIIYLYNIYSIAFGIHNIITYLKKKKKRDICFYLVLIKLKKICLEEHTINPVSERVFKFREKRLSAIYMGLMRKK